MRGFEWDIPVPKASVLSKMLPLNNRSIADLAKEEGISDATLYNWRQQARSEGIGITSRPGGPSPSSLLELELGHGLGLRRNRR